MRWLWIDTFVEFESGKRAVTIKNVTQSEDHLHDHFPGFPVMPASLMIEGMAQTAGILVGEARGFREKVLLAKIRRARFDDYCTPGDRIRYEAVIEAIDAAAATTHGIVYKEDRPIGEIDLMFSHADNASTDLGLPGHNFVFTDQFMDLLTAYNVKAAD